jgi:DNA-binding MarR family transcriptional regulator
MQSPRPPVSLSEITQASPCTWLRLRKLSRQLTNLYDQQLAPFGLTVTQFSLLAHLRALEGIGVGALAEAMVMDPTALSRALRPLQRDGFVHVRAGADDRRARRVHLTDEGRAAYEAARPAWRQAQQHVDAALRANDSPALNGLLDGLIDRMKSEPGPHTGNSQQAGKDTA